MTSGVNLFLFSQDLWYLNIAGADFRTLKLPLTSFLLFSLEFALSTLKTGVEMIILADYFYLNIKLLNS